MANYSIVDCTLEEHGVQILAILNEAIENSTALYDYQPRTEASMASWFESKRLGNYPVIGLVNDSGTLLGFGTLGAFRVQPAYKYTAEHSVYVHKDFRGAGFGKFLLERVIEAAKKLELHSLIGVIDSKNESSIALHEGLGFELVGSLPEVGFKFDRWLSVELYQLKLDGPANPKDG